MINPSPWKQRFIFLTIQIEYIIQPDRVLLIRFRVSESSRIPARAIIRPHILYLYVLSAPQIIEVLILYKSRELILNKLQLYGTETPPKGKSLAIKVIQFGRQVFILLF